MADSDIELRARVDSLTERMNVVERRLGIGGVRVAPEWSAPEMPRVVAPTMPPAAAAAPVAPPLAPPLAEEEPARTARGKSPALSRITTPHVRGAAQVEAALQYEPTHARRVSGQVAGETFSLERMIGGRWFAALGAIAVIAGLGLFLKLAYDRGWFSMSQQMRCISVAGFGFALLGVGEWARRKVNALASAGLSAAGIGAIYAAVLAAYKMYGLLPDAAAFALLAAAAGLGIAVAARARLASVAALSLIGGYLTPLLFAEAHASPLVMPAYLVALMSVGLVLSAWRGNELRGFRALRGLVWWGTVLMGTAWMFGLGSGPGRGLSSFEVGVGCGFLAVCWGALHAELVVSARRAEPADEFDERPRRAVKALTWKASRPFVTSFSTTVWAVGFGALLLGCLTGMSVNVNWLAPAAGAAASALLSMALSGNLRVLRDVPETDSQRLGAALMMETGALVIVAMALALGGWMQVVSWFGLGVAAVGAGRWMRSRGLDVYGLIVLSLGAARLIMVESWMTNAASTGTMAMGLFFTRWSLLMAAGGGAWLIAGRLLLRDATPAWRSMANAACGVGLALVFLAPMHEQSLPMAEIAVGLIAGAVVMVAARLRRSGGLVMESTLILALATMAMVQRTWWLTSASGDGMVVLGLHLTAWTAMVVAAGAAWIGCARIALSVSEEDWAKVVAPLLGAMGVALLFVSIEHQGVSQAALIGVWSVLGVAVIAARWLEPRMRLDVIGLTGLVAAAIRWGVVYPGSGWTEFGAGVAAPSIGMHPGLLTGLGLAAAMGVSAAWLLPRKRSEEADAANLRLAPTVIGTLLLFAATSFEVARAAVTFTASPAAQGGAVSIWWGLFAMGLLLVGFLRRVAAARYAGLGLVLVALTKTVLVDLRDIDPIWRVASFLALGMLMLGVAVVYARKSGMMGAGKRGAESEGRE